MHEGPLGVHQIELVVEAGPVSVWHDGWWLVVDAHLETGRTPIHKLDGALGLDGSDGSVDILGYDITTVKETTGHVLAVTGVALHHLVGWFEAGIRDFTHRQLFMISLLRRNNRSIRNQREVNAWVGHQVSLEFSEINVESAIETKGSRDGRYDLSNETVEVGVGWSFDVQITAADIVDSFVVNHEGTIRMFQGGVGSQDRVVRLNYCGGNLGSWVDSKFKFALLTVVNRKSFHEKRSEARSSTAAK